MDIEYLNQGTWKSICQRLVSKSEKMTSTRYNKTDDILTIEDIMQHLTNETSGNIHDNSICNDRCHPKNLVDYHEGYYHTANSDVWFVCFDFKEKSVKLTGYTIKSNNNSDGTSNPKSWLVEVSNDKFQKKSINMRMIHHWKGKE